MLFCDTVTVPSTQLIYTTYIGEVGRVFSPFTGFPSSSSTAKSTSRATSLQSSSSYTSSPAAPSSSPSTSSTQTTQSKSGSSTPAAPSQTSPTTSAAPPASQTGSPAPIGAIVGGSVGGVAVLAIIGVLLFFLLRLRKRSNADKNPRARYNEHGSTAYTPEEMTPAPALQPLGYSEPPMQELQARQYPQPQYPQQPNSQQSYVSELDYGSAQYAGHQQQTAYQQPYTTQDSHYSQQQGQQYYDPSQLESQYGRRVPVPAPVQNQYTLSSQSPSELSPSSGRSQGRAELHSQSPSPRY